MSSLRTLANYRNHVEQIATRWPEFLNLRKNRLWLTGLLLASTVSFAQGFIGIPENCRAPMAHDIEMASIPQLMHANTDVHIIGIVPVGNSHAKPIGAGFYRIDCAISVWWSDGHVDESYIFSAWDGPNGSFSGRYSPSNLANHTSSDNRTDSATTQLDLEALVQQASNAANVKQGIKHIQIEKNSLGYQIIIDYAPKFFVNEWEGREQAFANSDTYHLAESFVQLLVKHGLDPATPGNSVLVCAREGGIISITGKPQFKDLGCSWYDPMKDAVTLNNKFN